MLNKNNFYWGPLSVEEAHHKLLGTPLGTFLIRDSAHVMYFFAVSYSASQGPVSNRIKVEDMGFSLESEPTHRFPSLFSLLKHYRDEGKISIPHRKKKAAESEDRLYEDMQVHTKEPDVKESDYENMQVNNLGILWNCLEQTPASSEQHH